MSFGDGRQNSGKAATAACRDAAVEHGATVNGLPIIAEDDPHVGQGRGASVISLATPRSGRCRESA
jgi:hypothetical protein